MPSSRWDVAPVGQTSMQAGLPQWLQSTGRKTLRAAGYFPTSFSKTLLKKIPGGVACSALQAMVQALQPMQMLRSIIMP
jgi:hypothetical protein